MANFFYSADLFSFPKSMLVLGFEIIEDIEIKLECNNVYYINH